LEADKDESNQELISIRDQMILNEMELNHNTKYEQIRALFNVHISDQVEWFEKEKDEYLYFLSPDDPQVYNLEQQLVDTHSKKLKENLSKEEDIPELLLAHAVELFDDWIRDFLNDNRKALKTTQDVEEFVEDWTTFIQNILDSIHKGETKFWDEIVLDGEPTIVIQYLQLFLFWQKISTDIEQQELKILFSRMCKWISSHMTWSGVEREDLMIFYDTLDTLNRDFDSRKKHKKKWREICKELNNELNGFKSKFVILQVALFITSSVNSKGQFIYNHYNPGHRHFLYKFLEATFEKSKARKLLQLLEKCFGEFIKTNLQFNHQDPIDSPLNQAFKLPDFEDRVSYINFVEHMDKNKHEFESFLEEVHQPGILGQKGKERHDDHEKVLKNRKQILKASKILIDSSEESLISQFEKISPECDLGRHAIISVSGFLSEKDDNTEAWIGLCKSNLTLPVYSYRWSSKGSWSMLKPLVPTSVKSFFSLKNIAKRMFFGYKIITLPFDYKDIFMQSIEVAKKSGKLLAHSLMMQFPFINHSISLIGFSLGTQVIYSCLEELKAHGADNISE